MTLNEKEELIVLKEAVVLSSLSESVGEGEGGEGRVGDVWITVMECN